MELDWSLLRTVLAVADHGSLSGAARHLGQSQPTLGRHVKSAEQALACTLFNRQARGLVPTTACMALLPQLRAMAASAAQLRLNAAGHSETLSGSVRITASEVVALHLLPPIIAQMRRDEPRIRYDILPSDSSENLFFGKADIAIRMFRPEHPDMVTRKLGEIALGLYAHKSYLARRGTPKDDKDLISHDLVGYDTDERIIAVMRAQGLMVNRDHFVVRCDSDVHYNALIEAGCGIGALQAGIGGKNPALVRVLPDIPLPTLPVWLVAPASLLPNPRIRRVWDLLIQYLLPA